MRFHSFLNVLKGGYAPSLDLEPEWDIFGEGV